MNKPSFKYIGIIGKYNADHSEQNIKRLIGHLERHKLPYVLDKNTMPESLQHHLHARCIDDWHKDVDLCIVLGGDGTFLYASRALYKKQIPLIGINTGRLGFLADLSSEHMQAQLDAILQGNYISENRLLLSIEILQNQKQRAHYVAVNDAVIHKRKMARMVSLNTYARGHFLCHYHADGLILSTPTGSTAYALSAGGPILEPTLNALIIAPICPHTLTQRPVVLGSDSAIEVFPQSEQDEPNIQLTIDGQEEFILQKNDHIKAYHEYNIKVLHPNNYQFQRTLRRKLNWGATSEIRKENSKC